MEFYTSKAPEDPEWLARAALFHGHLGPWLIVGVLIGQDAIRRLDTPGQWKIDVTCWMPTDKQRTPYSCMLDGLQISSGATLGKQNIRFAYSASVLGDSWPVIHIMRLGDSKRLAEGLVYRATGRLHDLIGQIVPERLEEGSRELAGREIAELFEVRAMTDTEMLPRG